MEIQRFDALARQLGQGGTRRRLLGLFGGTALGGLIATTFGPEAEAKKKKKKKKSCKKKKCGECQICQKGKCKPKPDGTACSDGACEGGVCIGISNCPPAQVCELSETCCPEGFNSFDGVSFCGDDQQEICSCPAGDTFCPGADLSQCCLSGDGCSESGFCFTDTCSSGNDFCDMEFALCGENCGCLSSVGGANFCASLAGLSCSSATECEADAECAGNDLCVDIGCRCGGVFVGVCFPPCVANLQGAAARRAGSQRLRDRVGPLR